MAIIFKEFHRCVPAVKDRWTPIYLEHGRLEVDDSSVKWVGADGVVMALPAALLSALILGPGTTVTHAAISMCSRMDLPVVWVGEDGVFFYAFGVTVNEKCKTTMRHAQLYAELPSRESIAREMYKIRFGSEEVDVSTKTIEELRGYEGARMRDLYQSLADKNGFFWHGRNASGRLENLGPRDPLNNMVTIMNHHLYCLCLSAITTMGFIPALGFVHVDGKIPFVYDIADLFKREMVLEPSFALYARLLSYNRDASLQAFKEAAERNKIMRRIPDVLKKLMGV